MHGEKKTVFYRYGAVVTAILTLLAVFVLPVMPMNKVNAQYIEVNYDAVTIKTNPEQIPAATAANSASTG